MNALTKAKAVEYQNILAAIPDPPTDEIPTDQEIYELTEALIHLAEVGTDLAELVLQEKE